LIESCEGAMTIEPFSLPLVFCDCVIS
jgi:hypothetical protein